MTSDLMRAPVERSSWEIMSWGDGEQKALLLKFIRCMSVSQKDAGRRNRSRRGGMLSLRALTAWLGTPDLRKQQIKNQ